MADGPWVGFDLDGTLAEYDQAAGVSTIGAPIRPIVALLKSYLDKGTRVKIFTARVSNSVPELNEQAVRMIQAWCFTNIGKVLEVTNKKDFACIRIYDDIAVQVVKNEGRIVGDDDGDS